MNIKLDGITARAGALTSITRAGGDRTSSVAPSAGSDSLTLTDEALGLQALESSRAKGDGSFNMAKVDAIRRSIADGTYRADPHKIAAALVDMEAQLAR